MLPHWRSDRRGDRGQSSVEFALVVPLVLAVVLVIAQLALVTYSQLAVTHTAREVARTLAIDPDHDIESMLADTAIIDPNKLEIEISFKGSTVPGRVFVVVAVRAEVPRLPLVSAGGAFVHRASATAAMLVEQ